MIQNAPNLSADALIRTKLETLSCLDAELPGILIVHNIRNASVVYMSQKGLDELGITMKELEEMGPAYHERFFNPEESAHYVPAIFGLLERNNNEEIVSFFQQVRARPEDEWTWHACTTRIFLRDEENKPLLTLTIALPIDPTHQITIKVDKLLQENRFLREHYHLFAKLGRRERDVLRLLAIGKSSAEIAESLFISATTVDTHRRNIKSKLGVSTSYELSQFARAFDLI